MFGLMNKLIYQYQSA